VFTQRLAANRVSHCGDGLLPSLYSGSAQSRGSSPATIVLLALKLSSRLVHLGVPPSICAVAVRFGIKGLLIASTFPSPKQSRSVCLRQSQPLSQLPLVLPPCTWVMQCVSRRSSRVLLHPPCLSHPVTRVCVQRMVLPTSSTGFRARCASRSQ
jgi:hypothetical protein